MELSKIAITITLALAGVSFSSYGTNETDFQKLASQGIQKRFENADIFVNKLNDVQLALQNYHAVEGNFTSLATLVSDGYYFGNFNSPYGAAINITIDSPNNATLSILTNTSVADYIAGKTNGSVSGGDTVNIPILALSATAVASTDADHLDGLDSTQFVRSDISSVVTASTRWENGHRVEFGDTGSFGISHSGTSATITNAVGGLNVSNTSNGDNIIFTTKNDTGLSQQNLVLDGTGENVSLRHAGDERLSTTSTGVDLTGILDVDDGTGKGVINLGSFTQIASAEGGFNILSIDTIDGAANANNQHMADAAFNFAVNSMAASNSSRSASISTQAFGNTSEADISTGGGSVKLRTNFDSGVTTFDVSANIYEFAEPGSGRALDIDFFAGTIKFDDNKIFHEGNDGAGSLLDADLLDGIDSTQFARVDQANSFSGAINLQDNVALTLGNNNDLSIMHDGVNSAITNSAGTLQFSNTSNDNDITFQTTNSAGTSSNNLTLSGTAGNVILGSNGMAQLTTDDYGVTIDGRGSFVSDADSNYNGVIISTLAGNSESSIAFLSNAYAFQSQITSKDNGLSLCSNCNEASRSEFSMGDGDYHFDGTGFGRTFQIHVGNHNEVKFYGTKNSFEFIGEVTSSSLTAGGLFANDTNLTFNGNNVLTEGNMGAGSNIDADLLDGLDSTVFIRNDINTEQTIAGVLRIDEPGNNTDVLKFGAQNSIQIEAVEGITQNNLSLETTTANGEAAHTMEVSDGTFVTAYSLAQHKGHVTYSQVRADHTTARFTATSGTGIINLSEGIASGISDFDVTAHSHEFIDSVDANKKLELDFTNDIYQLNGADLITTANLNSQAINADTLDGLDSTVFLRNDINTEQSLEGDLRLNGTGTKTLHFGTGDDLRARGFALSGNRALSLIANNADSFDSASIGVNALDGGFNSATSSSNFGGNWASFRSFSGTDSSNVSAATDNSQIILNSDSITGIGELSVEAHIYNFADRADPTNPNRALTLDFTSDTYQLNGADIITTANVGSYTSGGDAETLDGLDSTVFLRNDINTEQAIAGVLRIDEPGNNTDVLKFGAQNSIQIEAVEGITQNNLSLETTTANGEAAHTMEVSDGNFVTAYSLAQHKGHLTYSQVHANNTTATFMASSGTGIINLSEGIASGISDFDVTAHSHEFIDSVDANKKLELDFTNDIYQLNGADLITTANLNSQAINADTLDGLDSTVFLRNDINTEQSLEGDLRLNGTGSKTLHFGTGDDLRLRSTVFTGNRGLSLIANNADSFDNASIGVNALDGWYNSIDSLSSFGGNFASFRSISSTNSSNVSAATNNSQIILNSDSITGIGELSVEAHIYNFADRADPTNPNRALTLDFTSDTYQLNGADIITTANVGSYTSGGDAETLDGLDSTVFLRNDINTEQTIAGVLRIDEPGNNTDVLKFGAQNSIQIEAVEGITQNNLSLETTTANGEAAHTMEVSDGNFVTAYSLAQHKGHLTYSQVHANNTTATFMASSGTGIINLSEGIASGISDFDVTAHSHEFIDSADANKKLELDFTNDIYQLNGADLITTANLNSQAINADTLDGLDSTVFLRNDINTEQSLEGDLRLNGTGSKTLHFGTGDDLRARGAAFPGNRGLSLIANNADSFDNASIGVNALDGWSNSASISSNFGGNSASIRSFSGTDSSNVSAATDNSQIILNSDSITGIGELSVEAHIYNFADRADPTNPNRALTLDFTSDTYQLNGADIITTANVGSYTSGGDAETLDGLDSTVFLRNDINTEQAIAGVLRIDEPGNNTDVLKFGAQNSIQIEAVEGITQNNLSLETTTANGEAAHTMEVSDGNFVTAYSLAQHKGHLTYSQVHANNTTATFMASSGTGIINLSEGIASGISDFDVTAHSHEFIDSADANKKLELDFTNDIYQLNGADLITTANVGSYTSGGDADTLDGLDSNQFLRKDINQTMNGNIGFGTNKAAMFGDSTELIIYHDSLNANIINQSGNLYFQNTNNGFDYQFNTRNNAGIVQRNLTISGGGENVVLGHAGVTKLETKATGIDVLGNADVTGQVNSASLQAGGLFADATTLTFNGNNVLTEGNMGAGSNIDADLLDGLDSTQFLRRDIDQTITADTTWGDFQRIELGNNGEMYAMHEGTGGNGFINNQVGEFRIFNGGAGKDIKFYTTTSGYAIRSNLTLSGNSSNVTLGYNGIAKLVTTIDGVSIYGDADVLGQLNSASLQAGGLFADDTTLTFNGNNVLTEGNMGAGSNIDADLLDGIDSTQFLRKDIDQTVNANTRWGDNAKIELGNAGEFQISHTGFYTHMINASGDLAFENKSLNRGIIFITPGGVFGDVNLDISGTKRNVSMRFADSAKLETKATGIDVFGNADVTGQVNSASLQAGGLFADATTLTFNGNNVLTEGNMGAGSNIDADLLDGLDSTVFLRNDISTPQAIGGDLTVSGLADFNGTVNINSPLADTGLTFKTASDVDNSRISFSNGTDEYGAISSGNISGSMLLSVGNSVNNDNLQIRSGIMEFNQGTNQMKITLIDGIASEFTSSAGYTIFRDDVDVENALYVGGGATLTVTSTVFTYQGNDVFHRGNLPTKIDVGLDMLQNYGISDDYTLDSSTSYASSKAVYDGVQHAIVNAGVTKSNLTNAVACGNTVAMTSGYSTADIIEFSITVGNVYHTVIATPENINLSISSNGSFPIQVGDGTANVNITAISDASITTSTCGGGASLSKVVSVAY